jgi:hypothetical protein
MLTITGGPITIRVEGDGADEGCFSFQYAGGDNHEAIFWAAMTALGLDPAATQPDTVQLVVTVVGEDGRMYVAYRRWEEGWGVGTWTVLGGPDVPVAGTYRVTSCVPSLWTP